MDSLVNILHIVLSFMVTLALLIVHFLVSVLELLLEFIKTMANSTT